jgi:hypothetical protein
VPFVLNGPMVIVCVVPATVPFGYVPEYHLYVRFAPVAVTERVVLWLILTDLFAGCCIAVAAVTGMLPDEDDELQPFAFVTVMPRETVELVEVKVIEFVPAPAVIVPPVIVHAYVPPLIAGTDAVALVPLQNDEGAVIATLGSALTATDFKDEATHPFCGVTVTASVTGPVVEVKVMALVAAPEVIVPPVIVHA